jgi:hypothetical protein
MSQLFDYFACSRPLIEQWAEALATRDADLRQEIETAMPGVIKLKNLSQNEFNLLAASVAAEVVDVVAAVGEVDLVKAVSAEEGPWVMAFRRPAVEAIAGMHIDQTLLDRWVGHTIELNGGTAAYYGKLLTAEAAGKFKELCRLAVAGNLGVFACFYG